MYNTHDRSFYLFGLWILIVSVTIVSCKKLDLKREIAVETTGAQLNQDNSVTVEGSLIDVGESTIVDHGHCWALTPEPNPTNNCSFLGTLNQTGSFSTSIPSLETGVWYIRSYVAVDTDPGPTYVYGSELSITVTGFACGTTLLDGRDGKTYSTVEIGTQCWMASNLNYGSFINSNGPTDNQLDNSIIEKYCYGDTSTTCADEGALYQWGEAMNYVNTEGTAGICPDGWHIPTDSEWKLMEMNQGMNSTSADTTDWRGTDEGTKIKVTGSTGFNANGTGYRKSDGSFVGNPEYGYFWTSSDYGTQAWSRGVKDTEAGIYRNTINKSYGLGVRCLLDQ